MYPWVGSPRRAMGVWGPSSSVWYGLVVTQDGPWFFRADGGKPVSHIDTDTIHTYRHSNVFLSSFQR